MGWEETLRARKCLFCWGKISTKYTMPISISGSNLTDGFNNTVPAPPYGSLSFNGINQGIVTSGTGSGSTNSALDLATGTPSYTIEFWFYTTQIATPGNPQYILNQGNATTINFQLINGNNSYITFNAQYLQAAFYSTTLGYVNMSSWPTTIAVNTWYHVALCRDTSNGNRYYLYLNGVLVSSTPNIVNPIANNSQGFEFGFPLSLSSSPIYSFNGYLSNMRIVKGVSVYVPPNFTVPTPPLESTQSLNLSGYNQAITGTQTSLLITTPYGALNDLASSFNIATMSTYVTYPSSSVYNFSTNNFTIEYWVSCSNPNPTEGPTYNSTAAWSIGTLKMVQTTQADSGMVLDLGITDGLGGGITLYQFGGANYYLFPANKWQHQALVRTGLGANETKFYVNGALVASGQMSSSLNLSSSQPKISEGFRGSFTNFRVVNGVAVYTSNFRPPTGQLTSTQSANVNGSPSAAITGTQTCLLLNATYGATFLADSSSNNFTPTLSSSAPTSANTGPAGTLYLVDYSSYVNRITGVNYPTESSMGPSTYLGSILFNGTNQYLYVPAATQFNYSTNDFTWEMWIYPTAATWTSGVFYLIDHGPQVNQGTLHYNGNKLVYYSYYNGNSTPPYTSGANFPSLYSISGGPITANTWTHIALCRQNLVTNMFINGKVVSSGPDPYNYAFSSGSPITYPPISPATQTVTIGSRSDGNYVFKGNISNVRIVNGVSVYNVGNFTPPVRPLPQVQGTNTIGIPSNSISGTQTSLLMNTSYNSGFLSDSSFNNVTITQQTIGSFPPSTYTMTSNSTNPFNSNGSIFTPGSIFFNGSSQYLTVPSNANLALGSGDFTVECWFYRSSNTGEGSLGEQGIISSGTVNNSQWTVRLSTSNKTLSYWLDGPANQVYGNTPTITGTWYHVALVRTGTGTNNISIYLNGVLDGQTTSTYTVAADTIVIGRTYTDYASEYFNGYISNVRVVKGTALYTQNFIPTSGPFTTSQTFNQSGIPSCPVQSSQTSLLLTTPSNSSYLTDSSTNAFTVTNVGTATSEPFNPFSGNYEILANPGSVLLNGTTQYLTFPDNSVFSFGTEDFTIEAWVYPTSVAAGANQFTLVSLGFPNFQFFISDGTLYYYDIFTGGPGQIAGGTVVINKWQHLAVSRTGTLVKCYINGVECISTTSSSNIISGTNYIGYNGGSFAWGYISNFRIVKGVAVYNGSFPPPTTPLTAVTGTQLLVDVASSGAYLTDGSTNNFTLTPTGTVTYNSSTPVSSGGSLFFDQSTISYLTLPSSNAFDLTGNFTIEAWVYMTTLLAGENGIFDARVNGQTAAPWAFYVGGDGKLQFFTGTYYIGATTISTGVWTHVAAVRSSSTLTLYVNGVPDYTANIGTGAISPGTTSAFIGTKDYGINAQFRTIDYITNLRIVNGTAIYTGSFIPPPGPLNNSQSANQNGSPSAAVTISQTSLLLNTAFGTNFLVDGSINNFTVTNNGTATSATLDPFVF